MESGEFELIAELRARIERAGAPAASSRLVLGSGDDASISVPEGATATSVDALVEGVHFRMPPFRPRDVGHKALAGALSDLAAMGAAAGEAYVQLGVREDLADSDLHQLADGLGALAATHGVAVAGGDVVRAPALFVAVTVVGHAAGAEELVRRAGAREGDLLVVTGELGGAAAGLVLSERPQLGSELARGVAEALLRRQLEPQPRLAAGRALAAAGARAMIDLSDGLAGDARHLASASAVALEIEASRLPVQPGVAEVAAAAGIEPLELVAAGGEDYELLVALEPQRAEEAREATAGCGLGLTVIGSVRAGDGVAISGGPDRTRTLAGFDQLRSRPAPGGPA